MRLKMSKRDYTAKKDRAITRHEEEMRVLRRVGCGYGRSCDTAIIVSEIDWFVGPTSDSALL